MYPQRWLPLIGALALFGAGCQPKSEPSENKPAISPEVSLPGVDTSALTPRERREWAGQVSELLAPCADTPVSIAQCVKEQRACKACLPAAQYLLGHVKAGRAKSEREQAFHSRFDANKTKTLVLDGSPFKGPPEAPVTIVEWADFECSACRVMAPVLDQLAERFPGQVKFVYKYYPLMSHPHGEIAARAGIAAQNQDKFWEMHHQMFEHQDRLEQTDLEQYARTIGVDLPRFKKDLTAEETTQRIEKDKKQADELGLTGTPMVFINGREVETQYINNLYEDLEDWVKLDLQLAGIAIPPPPAKAAPKPENGAAPTASVAASAAPATSAAPAAGAASASSKPAAGGAKAP
ncbi:DsbA family protein [Chondromyces apiculatus]|uniref:Periplasmic thiol:disulfide interchange protein DsbA n=1 Tax=Chondromyces apiculatus DSM 436 TaxID=1192034 RepID=A0A017TB11_9BACT|nr:thioredoxin domain-containing protein [Chondromyces apiculatus]EYF06473.1 Periplasmic thiol:disulfide interchange protein DsbA [Chondromyces apiculatus DSM 436]